MAWAPDYVTTTELKAYTRVSGSADDAVCASAIAAASRTIDQYCNRQFGLVAAAEDRIYTAEWDRFMMQWVIPIDDLSGPLVTGMSATVEAGTLTVTPRPVNAPQKGSVFTSLVVDTDSAAFPCGSPDEVTVTAQWGWLTVPEPIKTACLLQSSRVFSRRNSPFGISGSPDLQGELRLLAKVDADVSVILQPYVRWWAAR